jgi:MarR-like DNA-binding transcriptional regulator SgrR of sgrS sRNA
MLKYDPENYAALGMHLLEAGKTEQGVDFLLLAGDQALSLFAHQEAIDNYLQALEYAKETENDERAARILMKLGLAYHSSFEFAESRRAYEQGFIFWQRASETVDQKQLPTAPHALRFASRPPVTLDPGRIIDGNSSSFAKQLFSGLVKSTADFGIEPDLARSWEVLDGGRKYVFYLRDDARWSDGEPVTASDFEFGWKRVLDPETRSPITGLFLDIKGADDFIEGNGSLDELGVNATSEYTLTVELENPTGYFLQLLDYPAFGPVPVHQIEAHGSGWADPGLIITNGPFRINTWEEDRSLGLVKNSSYHGQFGGNLTEVKIEFHQPGEGDLYQRYERSETDMQIASYLSPEDQARARHVYADEYIAAPSSTVLFLAFNLQRPPFDDAARLLFSSNRRLCTACDSRSPSQCGPQIRSGRRSATTQRIEWKGFIRDRVLRDFIGHVATHFSLPPRPVEDTSWDYSRLSGG